ncbi:MAG: hypothetical protein RIR01_613 [Bacteroidota bacterium]|jgi:lysophospholipase L1-like esterase
MKNFKSSLFTFLCTALFFNSYGQNKEFYFGTKTKTDSGIVINNSNLYTDALGYGFDCNSSANVKLNDKSMIGDKSIYFSVKLPEGNYKVDLIIGGDKAANTTVKAESRRLMLKEIKTKDKEIVRQSFVVNVRTPKIDAGHKISLKKREYSYLNWDDKLTLEFSGNLMIESIKITLVPGFKRLFLVGDTTVADQDLEPWGSWGQFITNYFTADLVVANYAESGGGTLKSFKASRRLDKVFAEIKKGDYLFIESAHNDEKEKGEGAGAWGEYSSLLKEYITKTREKGGIPVFLTPIQRRHFKSDGTLQPTHGEFPDAMRKIATDLNVPLIDITKMTTEMYESWGDQASKKAFVQYPANTFPGQTTKLEDNTQLNSFGANEVAKCVVQGIKDLNLGIAKFIKTEIPNYNPKKPASFSDWTVPMSSRFEIAKQDEN